MNGPTLATLQQLLADRKLGPEELRNDLLTCLDLTPEDDADANELRYLLEKMDLPAALDELQRTLAEICARPRPT